MRFGSFFCIAPIVSLDLNTNATLALPMIDVMLMLPEMMAREAPISLAAKNPPQ